MGDRSDTSRKITSSPTPLSPVQWNHEIIPETHNGRTLVLCFDGTGDKFDSDVRNPTIPPIPFHNYHQPHFRVMIELERRAVYIAPKEGQEA